MAYQEQQLLGEVGKYAGTELKTFQADILKTGSGSLHEEVVAHAKKGERIDEVEFSFFAEAFYTTVQKGSELVLMAYENNNSHADDILFYVRKEIKTLLTKGNIYDDFLVIDQSGSKREVSVRNLDLHRYAELFVEALAYIESAAKGGAKTWPEAKAKLDELAMLPASKEVAFFAEKIADLRKKYKKELEPVFNEESAKPEFLLTTDEVTDLEKLLNNDHDNFVSEIILSYGLQEVSSYDEGGGIKEAVALEDVYETFFTKLKTALTLLATKAKGNPGIYAKYPHLGKNTGQRATNILAKVNEIIDKNQVLKNKDAVDGLDQDVDRWEQAAIKSIRVDNERLGVFVAGLEAQAGDLDPKYGPLLDYAIKEVTRVGDAAQASGIVYAQKSGFGSDAEYTAAYKASQAGRVKNWQSRLTALKKRVVFSQQQNSAQQAELPKKPQDEPALWEAYIDTLISMERFDLLLKEVRALIMDRLNLVVESTNQNYGRKNELKAYSDKLQNIEITPGETHEAIKRELMKKAQEIEKIRTITDAAQVCANSASMAADWAGFATQESGNGLSVNYYDYFFLENDDGNKYKYAEVVENAILELVDWHQFGEGVKWDDGPLWKDKQRTFVLAKIEDYAKKNGLTISDEDRGEIWGIIYNICYGLGIRQHTFLGQYAMGATPGGKLGDLGKWLQAQFFHDHRYKTYKDVEFNPAAELFEAPQPWTDSLSAVYGLVYPDRLSSISKSTLLTRATLKTIAPLRKPCLMGVKEEGFNGPTLATTYHTLFEAVFLKARARAEQRKKKKDFTFANFVSGYEALLGYKEHAFAVPGGTAEGLEKKDPKELREKLIEDFGTLLKKHSSYLKKNAFSINWNHVAYITLMYVDKMFRVYRLCDQTPAGSAELLKMVREQLKEGANNLAGLGKREEIYDVASDEPTAWHETEIYDVVNGRKVRRVEHRHKQDYDIRDFVLNRIPTTLEEYEGINPIGMLAAKYAKARNAAISVGPVKIGNTDEAKQRVMAKSGYGYLYRPIEKLKLLLDRREMKALETFQHTASYIYGMPVAKQQQSPDKK